jgi:hypothetical protein
MSDIDFDIAFLGFDGSVDHQLDPMEEAKYVRLLLSTIAALIFAGLLLLTALRIYDFPVCEIGIHALIVGPWLPVLCRKLTNFLFPSDQPGLLPMIARFWATYFVAVSVYKVLLGPAFSFLYGLPLGLRAEGDVCSEYCLRVI